MELDQRFREWDKKHLPAVASRVRDRMGTTEEALLPSDILDMFETCRMELSVLNVSDNMCDLFDDTDVRLLRLREDLSTYYVKGYGTELSYRVASPLLADLITSMQSVVDGAGGVFSFFSSSSSASSSRHLHLHLHLPQVAHLRFAHAETILPLVALLGCYPSSPDQP